MPIKNIRIAKFIAGTGTASRRDTERLIESGLVSVDGITINSPVFFVSGFEKIIVSGKNISMQTESKLYAFHKPINTMTTTRDPMGRRTIYDCLAPEYKNLKYIGRLDFKTTGLLLMTNDGALARELTLPESNIRRTYIARVRAGDLSDLDLARRGMTIDGINYRPMDISVLENGDLKIIITEGKKNEVRIVLGACGLPVIKLHRISFGNIDLGNLSAGEIVRVDKNLLTRD